MPDIATSQLALRLAARALGRAGLVHAYGHCSLRLDTDRMLVCAPKAMGTILPGEEGDIVAINDPLPDGILGEVRIHQQVYRKRPELNAVCRIMPPNVMTLSTLGRTPRPRHGIGAYFAPQPPLWDDPRLLRDDGLATLLAERLGGAMALVMRGNGAISVGENLMEAVTMAWFLEDAARVEVELAKMGQGEDAGLLSDEEAKARQVKSGGVYQRMWDYLTYADPEKLDER